ncbi:CLUMA_CG005344, isoform A [Clunio marinus]|uniref:CLUMA_CG005344, isoform A n=1 Tax=Clunio marinus TaxID=568069 RepID=A0A1J1HZY6_9DIPT|nr:CLUMA_CG005344, isoform A [Clunio marinus]
MKERKFPTCPGKPDVYYAHNILFDGNSILFQYAGDIKIIIILDFGTKIKERAKWEKELLRNKTLAQKSKH